MLHRVVMKRSGRRPPIPPTGSASGFTAADHLICTIVRQARNFPPAAGILQVEAEEVSATKLTAHSRAGIKTRMPSSKLAREFPVKIPLGYQFPDSAGEAFQLPRAAVRQILFLFMAGTAPPRQSLQCPGPIVPSLYSVRVSVSSLVWLGDR
jgi:hypothetical protein